MHCPRLLSSACGVTQALLEGKAMMLLEATALYMPQGMLQSKWLCSISSNSRSSS